MGQGEKEIKLEITQGETSMKKEGKKENGVRIFTSVFKTLEGIFRPAMLCICLKQGQTVSVKLLIFRVQNVSKGSKCHS